MAFGEPHKTFSQKVAEVTDEVIAPVIPPAVENYLENNPPITIDEIKSDPDIADSISKKHSNTLDHSNSLDHSNTNDLSSEQKTALTGGGETNLHSHDGGGGADPWTIIKLAQDFTKSTTANDPVPNFFFTPQPNKTYLIFGYFLLRTATTTIGARPGIAWPTGLIDAIMRMEASSSLTASAIRTFGAQTTQNAASTGLATTTHSHWGSLDGIIITGASVSGNFQITLASETAGTNVTMKAGSILMYREI